LNVIWPHVPFHRVNGQDSGVGLGPAMGDTGGARNRRALARCRLRPGRCLDVRHQAPRPGRLVRG